MWYISDQGETIVSTYDCATARPAASAALGLGWGVVLFGILGRLDPASGVVARKNPSKTAGSVPENWWFH